MLWSQLVFTSIKCFSCGKLMFNLPSALKIICCFPLYFTQWNFHAPIFLLSFGLMTTWRAFFPSVPENVSIFFVPCHGTLFRSRKLQIFKVTKAALAFFFKRETRSCFEALRIFGFISAANYLTVVTIIREADELGIKVRLFSFQ